MMTRLLTVLLIALTLSVGGAIGLVRPDGRADAPPATADAAAVADAAASVHGDDLDTVVAGLQTRLRALPGDAPGWATLALAYVEQARLTGDPSLYRRAAAAVGRSLREQPRDNAGALASRAALAAARHHFADALHAAQQSLAIDPFQPGALAVRVDALTELGHYDRQLRALREADRRQPGLPVTTRYSYAFELRGRLARAAGLLAEAAQTTSPADRAFVLTLLADIERRSGQLRQASLHLREALQASPAYVPAMASGARLAVARGDLQQAVRRWQAVVLRLPVPEYVTELGELRLFLGEPGRADKEFGVVTATNQLLSRNGVDTDLESALFEADHGSPATALTAARAEWRRRHSIHVADVLGWSLHRNGEDRQALRYARLATRLGTVEARLWLHRGAIEAGVGLDMAARRHLRRGLSTDPGLSPWQAAQGRAVLRDLGSRR